jgi:phosphotransferase system, enzyme I, PtsP
MLKLLRNIIQEVHAAQDFEEALNIIVKRVRKAIDTQSCSILLVNKDGSELVLMATDGLGSSEAVKKIRIPMGKGLVSVVAKRGEPLNIDDATKHPDFFKIPTLGKEPYRAFLGVPIKYRRKLLGVLIVQQHEIRRYDEAEEAFLITIAVRLSRLLKPYAEEAGILLKAKKSTEQKAFTLQGTPGAVGVGIGQGMVVYLPADLNAVPNRKAENIDEEIAHFTDALTAVREATKILGERLAPNLPKEEQVLFDAYLKILDSNSLGDEVNEEIRKGHWAQGALKRVIKKHVREFEVMENEYFRERAADLKDLGRRVLAHLQSEEKEEHEYPEQTILVGEEISASNLAEVPEGQLAGIVSARGSSNSHVAILARSLGVPTVMGVEDLPVVQLDKKQVVVDGYFGRVYVSPQPRLLKAFQTLAKEESELDADLEALRDLPAETQDGHRINMYVNAGLMVDIGKALTAGAEGVGLYRTEIPFMIRDRFPSSEEQRVIYRQLLSTFSPRAVVMRILDIGGDKPLSYFPINEKNPFLGWRGIRMLLDHPEIFSNQLRSMLRASEGLDNLRIMFPMVSNVSQVDESLELLSKAYREVTDEGLNIVMPKVGVMIEVPSAVYQTKALARKVDFLSVGSNDLTQYLLAVDRNNEQVSDLYDSLHPAVLRALIQVVEEAHQAGKKVSLCGEMAGDPAAVILLLGIGFDSLSMHATNLLRMKWVVRQVKLSRAKKLLKEVLNMENARQIRNHMEQVLDELGLGGLIRAGKR